MSFLDKLPKLPFVSKETDSEYFFALNIKPKEVEAALWTVSGSKLQILSVAQAQYSTHEELVEAANASLDKALADFEPEPTQILFGVPQSWLLDDDLKMEYLKLLKALVSELDLSPMAYVATSHAVSHLLQNTQGVPTTAILINFGDPLEVTLVKAGKIVDEKTIKRSAGLAEDIEKALLNFTEVEILPSKILMFGDIGVHEEKFKDELLSFPWMENLPFLHLPKVEILPERVALVAVALAGAAEISPDINFSEKDLVEAENLMVAVGPVKSHLHNLPELEDEISKGGEPESEDMGFVSGDIEEIEKEQALINRSQKTPERYGQDFVDSGQGLKAKLLGLLLSLKHLHLKNLPIPKFTLAIPLLIFILLVGAYLYIPKGKVIIFVDPKILEKEAQVMVDPKASKVDEEKNIIPGEIIETTLTGTEKGSATGKKKIGDKASGSVIIYNKTYSAKTFSQGTVLVGENKLEFTLDSTVNVASQSAVEGGISFGKETARVSASEIGPEGNLPAGKELSFKSFSINEFDAKVDQAFSGGTSKDVTVVTVDDRKRLQASALSNLRKKAKDDLEGKLSGDSKILEETLTENITKESYSKNTGDQASDFSLTLTARFKGTAYSDSTLKSMIGKLVETNIPEGFVLNLSETEAQAGVAKVEKDGRLIFLSKFRAKLVPKLDEAEIAKKITGKTPEEVANILKEMDHVISSEIVINPSLPGPLQRLPYLTQNISIEVKTK